MILKALELGFIRSSNPIFHCKGLENMKMAANVKGTDLSSGPKDVTQAGTYHCQILGTRTITTKTSKLCDVIDLEVLAGTEPGQEGNRITCFLTRRDGVGDAQWSDGHIRWAWASKLIEPGGPDIDFKPELLQGREVICDCEINKQNRASVAGFGDAVYRVDSPEVASVPKARPRDAFGEVKPEESKENLDGLFG